MLVDSQDSAANVEDLSVFCPPNVWRWLRLPLFAVVVNCKARALRFGKRKWCLRGPLRIRCVSLRMSFCRGHRCRGLKRWRMRLIRVAFCTQSKHNLHIFKTSTRHGWILASKGNILRLARPTGTDDRNQTRGDVAARRQRRREGGMRKLFAVAQWAGMAFPPRHVRRHLRLSTIEDR